MDKAPEANCPRYLGENQGHQGESGLAIPRDEGKSELCCYRMVQVDTGPIISLIYIYISIYIEYILYMIYSIYSLGCITTCRIPVSYIAGRPGAAGAQRSTRHAD